MFSIGPLLLHWNKTKTYRIQDSGSDLALFTILKNYLLLYFYVQACPGVLRGSLENDCPIEQCRDLEVCTVCVGQFD